MGSHEAAHWWKLATGVPCSGSRGDVEARHKMFTKMDGNGNGFLSMTEVERFMEKTLGAEDNGEAAPHG